MEDRLFLPLCVTVWAVSREGVLSWPALTRVVSELWKNARKNASVHRVTQATLFLTCAGNSSSSKEMVSSSITTLGTRHAESVLEALSDKATGGAMLFAAASVFIYYTIWTILLVSRSQGRLFIRISHITI